jgi:hypothetical protein
MRIKFKVIETYGKKNNFPEQFDFYNENDLYPEGVLRLIKVFNLFTFKCDYVIQISHVKYVFGSDRIAGSNTWKDCDINKVKVPITLSRYLKIKKLQYENKTKSC